jgi:hypothetical protein
MGVSVVPRGQDPGDAMPSAAGNILEVTLPHKAAVDTARPFRRPTISWAADDRLNVTYDARWRILTKVESHRGVTVTYQTY